MNERLRTEDPRVYAIGECALHDNRFYGFVAPGYRMAEVLVSNLLGGDRTCADFDTSTRLKIEGLEVNIVGDPWGAGESLSHATDGDYRQLVVERGRITGMTVVGSWPELGRLKEVHRNSRRLSRFRLARFRRTGKIWSERSGLEVTRWPAGAVVCECMGVTLGELQDARARHGATVAALSSVTGASTVCGSCEHLLARISGEESAVPIRRERVLLVASALGAVACVTTVVAAPVPLSTSVREAAFDVLWRVGLWKQVTGFTLAIACASSLVLSLRKRWRRFQRGEYSSWRALHAALGASTLAFLFLHTGFRLGANFNLALMATFLALTLLGGFAGAVTALESRFSPPITPGLRVLSTRLHLLFFWPLFVLILFHVVTVYYF